MMKKNAPGAWLALAGVALSLLFHVQNAGAMSQAPAGIVLDPQNRPIAGARVEVLGPSEDTARETVTDHRGRFVLPAGESGPWRLRVTARGFDPFEGEVAAGDGGSRLRVHLALGVVEQQVLVSATLPDLASELTIDSASLERRAPSDLAAGIRREAGIGAVRRASINLEPTIRGLQEAQVAMFVDGTRTFAAGPARMDSDVSHVNPHAVGKIRVVKGPYALAWGAGALSALDIEMRRPSFTSGGFQWNGIVSGIYHGNTEVSDSFVGVWGGGERFRFAVNGGRREGGDYESGDGSEVPGDFESFEGRWSLGWKINDAALLEYSGGYQAQDDIDYPGRLLDATYFNAHSHSLEIRWAFEGGGPTEVYGQIYNNSKDHRMNNDEKPTAQPAPGRIPPFALRVDLPTESDTTGGRFYLAWDHGAWDWQVGTDYFLSEQTARRQIFRRQDDRLLFDDIVWPDAEIEDLGFYGRGLYRSEGWQLGAAVRLDRVETTAGETSEFFRLNTVGDLDQDESNFSAAVNLQVRPRENWLLTAGVGRAVRTATALERYSDRFPSTKFQIAAEFMGNPALDPEESLELDLGSTWTLGGLRIGIDVFYRVIDDYITVAPDPSLPKRLPLSPPVVFRYVNGDEATFLGGELELGLQLSSGWDWWLAADYVRAEDETFDEPVLGIKPLTGRVGLRWRGLGNRLALSGEALFVAEQDRVATTRFEQETPSYEVFDLRGEIRVTERVLLRAGVENLTDEAYADHLNSPNPFSRQRILEPGRSAYAGVQLQF